MQDFLAAVGVAAITFVILMLIRSSRGFRDHMRVVHALSLTNEQGFALSRLAAAFTNHMGRGLRYRERFFLGTVIIAMEDEDVATLADRSTSNGEALVIFGRTLRDMENFARTNPDLMQRLGL